jgi:hypothetical protein
MMILPGAPSRSLLSSIFFVAARARFILHTSGSAYESLTLRTCTARGRTRSSCHHLRRGWMLLCLCGERLCQSADISASEGGRVYDQSSPRTLSISLLVSCHLHLLLAFLASSTRRLGLFHHEGRVRHQNRKLQVTRPTGNSYRWAQLLGYGHGDSFLSTETRFLKRVSVLRNESPCSKYGSPCWLEICFHTTHDRG